MQQPPRRFMHGGAIVLGVHSVPMVLAVVPSAARAASSSTVQTITISRAGGGGIEHFDPCSAPSDGTTLALAPGDTLKFQNNLTRDIQVTFTDVTNNTTQTFHLPKMAGQRA